MDFCILSSGMSNLWVIITTCITFSAVLIISSVSLITKATEKNKNPKAKRVIIITTISSFFVSSIFFVLVTRSLFVYELSGEDYGILKYYLQNHNKSDVVLSRVGTEIIFCKRNNISKEMKEILNEAKENGYMTYEDLICFSKKSCK